MKFFSLLSLAILFNIAAAFAQQPDDAYLHKFGIDTKNVPTGLKVGEKAPNFISPNQYGKSIELSKLLTKGPVVLIFYRGYWCPLCNKHLAKFQDSLKYITNRGAQIVAISAQTYGNSEKMIHQQNITFNVISDTTDKIMKDYKVLFHVTTAYQAMLEKYIKKKLNQINAQKSAELPVPATYVINQKGIIVYRQFNYDYSKRSSVKEVLEHLPKN